MKNHLQKSQFCHINCQSNPLLAQISYPCFLCFDLSKVVIPEYWVYFSIMNQIWQACLLLALIYCTQTSWNVKTRRRNSRSVWPHWPVLYSSTTAASCPAPCGGLSPLSCLSGKSGYLSVKTMMIISSPSKWETLYFDSGVRIINIIYQAEKEEADRYC